MPSLGDPSVHGHVANVSNPDLERREVLAVPDFFHFKKTEPAELLGTTRDAEIVI